ncbi:glycosyltransferase involved in cell wall biosynthesis [Lacinutrix venerupis]|nr:glycosyltransferase involved in cell wall biosynthesis [Lacinutrix venerupis]
MKNVKLAIVYQVIFHYRVPFYKEIENDSSISSILLHGNGVKNTKLQNASNNLNSKRKLFTLKFPYKKNNEKKYFTFFPFLFFSLVRVNPDVILLEGASSLINNISSILYSKMFRKKVIYWSLGKLENTEVSTQRSKVDKLINFMENKVNSIFTYSTIGRSYFENRVDDPNKIFVGVNVLDTREILKKESKKVLNFNRPFTILFVGSIIPAKNLELLIEVFLEFEKKCTNSRLDIIGSGAEYYNNLKQTYQSASDNIHFHGRITEGLEEYYFNSDIFVLPGLGGLAICESMAYGLPVVCSSADGTEKDLIDNNSGFIINDMTKENLLNLLNKLSSDRSILQEYGVNAKQRIKTKYSFESYYDTFKKSLIYAYEN